MDKVILKDEVKETMVMCTSKNCPYRATCNRSRAMPTVTQTYNNFEYICNENNGFADFIQYGEIRNASSVDGNVIKGEVYDSGRN